METIILHSLTDLITNSSTVIYTYSDSSPKALCEMIDEIFKVLGVEQKCEDIFTIYITKDTSDYSDWICDRGADEDNPDGIQGVPKELMDYKTSGKAMDKLVADITSGKVKKPDWFVEMEEELVNGYDDYPPETTMCVEAKDPKYENLAKLVVKFLYSTGHEATRDG